MRHPHSLFSERGFTLLELMFTVSIGITVMALAIASMPSFAKSARADGGLELVVAGLRSAREMSVGSRRNMQLTFPTVTTMAINRVEYPSGTLTLVRTVVLEGRVEFRLTTGLADTPDAFGKATATALGTHTPAMYVPDGSFVDSNGDVLNGTLFLGIPGDTLSARAVTLFGPTGAIRLWKWDGRKWSET